MYNRFLMSGTSMARHDDFQQGVTQVQFSIQRACTGDPEPIKALYSHADDATIMGAWGAYEHGWAQVGPRLDWAVTRFLEGHITFHPIAIGDCGSLGYTIWIEKGEARLQGSDGIRPFALRVTQLYRRENGAWKIIQRHADPMMEKMEAPKSVS
jgi:ketosteroid isomerase-like protein